MKRYRKYIASFLNAMDWWEDNDKEIMPYMEEQLYPAMVELYKDMKDANDDLLRSNIVFGHTPPHKCVEDYMELYIDKIREENAHMKAAIELANSEVEDLERKLLAKELDDLMNEPEEKTIPGAIPYCPIGMDIVQFKAAIQKPTNKHCHNCKHFDATQPIEGMDGWTDTEDYGLCHKDPVRSLTYKNHYCKDWEHAFKSMWKWCWDRGK